jgi:hypothetical protein
MRKQQHFPSFGSQREQRKYFLSNTEASESQSDAPYAFIPYKKIVRRQTVSQEWMFLSKFVYEPTQKICKHRQIKG